MIGGVKAIAGVISTGLGLARGWIERQDKQDLRESGALEEITRASASLLETVRKKNAVDDALFGDGDPAWADRLRRDAEAAGGPDR